MKNEMLAFYRRMAKDENNSPSEREAYQREVEKLESERKK